MSKVSICISPIVCRYLFLHNLSRWHYSTIEPFARYWSSTPTRLTDEEREAIAAWGALEKRNFQKTKSFLAQRYVQGGLSVIERKRILKLFAPLEPRFQFHYRQQHLNMVTVARYLKTVPLGNVLRQTSLLYGKELRSGPIYVTLSHDAARQAGGMSLGNKTILQFGDYILKSRNEEVLSILFHEMTHEATVEHLMPARVSIKLPKLFSGTPEEYIDEIIHQAVWGEIGLLSQRYFKLSEQEVSRRKIKLTRALSEPFRSMTMDAFTIRPILQICLKEKASITHRTVESILRVIKRTKI